MKITIEKVNLNENGNRSGWEMTDKPVYKMVLGLEKLPPMNQEEWNVLKEALDHLTSILMKIDT